MVNSWDGWRDVTPRRDDPDLETARRLAYEAATEISFHEVALDSAFKAEHAYNDLGRKILLALGYPDAITVWEPDE